MVGKRTIIRPIWQNLSGGIFIGGKICGRFF